ncbi:MAG: sigma-70 family RNA polymerase sigma factor [Planctomycetes bacterium]|nr:sigma-70 family RNA polymerase sigma factor [Planctomycetota bacterium]
MSGKSAKNFSMSGPGRFATTHWSVVLQAGQPKAPGYQQALETLCQSYWFPLYAYLRRHGYSNQQAEDHTQAFFCRIMEKQVLRMADSKRGKFRSFLLGTLKHFLSDEYDRARAQKRGGGRKILSIDFTEAENQYSLEPAHGLSPEKLFDKSWALTVLDRTMAHLKAELASQNKQELFDHLKIYLTVEKGSIPYRDKAAELNMTEGNIRTAVHRLRRRYRKLLREEIAQTVAAEDQVDDEIDDLFNALAY